MASAGLLRSELMKMQMPVLHRFGFLEVSQLSERDCKNTESPAFRIVYI